MKNYCILDVLTMGTLETMGTKSDVARMLHRALGYKTIFNLRSSRVMRNIFDRKILMMIDKLDGKIGVMFDKLPLSTTVRMMLYLLYVQVGMMFYNANFEISVMFDNTYFSIKRNAVALAVYDRTFPCKRSKQKSQNKATEKGFKFHFKTN